MQYEFLSTVIRSWQSEESCVLIGTEGDINTVHGSGNDGDERRQDCMKCVMGKWARNLPEEEDDPWPGRNGRAQVEKGLVQVFVTGKSVGQKSYGEKGYLCAQGVVRGVERMFSLVLSHVT